MSSDKLVKSRKKREGRVNNALSMKVISPSVALSPLLSKLVWGPLSQFKKRHVVIWEYMNEARPKSIR
jgi:hypothetical protein